MTSTHNEGRDFGMEIALTGLRNRGYEPAVVFDIGAADGGWTRMARGIWSAPKFVGCEPLQERRPALEALVADFPNQVSFHDCGLGDADRELSLGVTDFLWDSSFAYGGSSARKVMVRRLDSLHRDGRIPYPTMVKIDVQGFERRVLEGGRSVLSRADFILMECNFFSFSEDIPPPP